MYIEHMQKQSVGEETPCFEGIFFFFFRESLLSLGFWELSGGKKISCFIWFQLKTEAV